MHGANGHAKGRASGQSTLEYILVMAAILVAVIVAANALIAPSVNNAMTQSSVVVTTASGKMKTGLGLP